MKNKILNFVLTLVFGLVLYYFMLPPLNLHAISFYLFVFLIGMFYLMLSVNSFFTNIRYYVRRGRAVDGNRIIKYVFIGLCSIFPIILIVNIICSPVYNAKKYYNRINVNEESDFSKDIK